MLAAATPLDSARLDLALKHAGIATRAELAVRLGVSERTIARALSASSTMFRLSLRALLGAGRWRFVCGDATDLIAEDPPAELAAQR